MGILISFINGVRKINRIKNVSKDSIEEPRIGMRLILEKIKIYLLSLIKGFFYQILLYGFILVVVIASVGVIFEFFSSWKFGDTDSAYDMDYEDVKIWSEGLSEKEIKEMGQFGASIHPRKISKYIELENKSYKPNITIKIPVKTERIVNGVASEIETTYEDYSFNIGDVAYPYRFWWQSVAGIDSIVGLAQYEDELGVIESSKQSLMPSFNWADNKTESYSSGSKYNGTSKYERIHKTTTIVETKNYEDGSYVSTDTVKTIVTKTYPLAVLQEVETMFSKINFEYASDNTSNSSSSGPVTDSWEENVSGVASVTKYKYDEEGNLISQETVEEPYEDIIKHKTITNSSTTISVNSWKHSGESKEYLDKFMGYLVSNGVNVQQDLEIMNLMIENLPQNYDFMHEFNGYLQYAEMEGLEGFRGGFSGGSFSGIGNYEILPSDFLRNIPLFMQTDRRWASVPYCYYGNSYNGTIGTSACGPTSMAMAIVGLGGYSIDIDLNKDGITDPYEASMYALDKNHRIYGSGTSWAFFNDIGRKTGLTVKQVPTSSWKSVLNALQVGNPVIASMGPGVFTSAGHYITLIGIDESGNIIVNDGNSVSRSNRAWSFSNVVLPQAKQFWIISK